MNRYSPSPDVMWPYRPRNTHRAAQPDDTPVAHDDGFDDAAARLAGPGRTLQLTMDAMVRSAVMQIDRPHQARAADLTSA